MEQSRHQKLRFQIFLFTITRTVLNTNIRMVYPLMPLFASQLGVTLDQMALGLSVRSFLGVLAPFLAGFADTKGRKTGIILSLGLYIMGISLSAVTPGFITFILGSSLALVANGIFIPSMQAFLSDKVDFKRRGTVLSFTELSWALAFIIGVPIVNAVMVKSSYVVVLVGMAGLGVLLTALLFWALPKHEVVDCTQNELLRNFKKVLTYTPALAGILMGVLYTAANETVNLVFGDWIKEGFGLTFAALTVASIVIGSSEMASELLSVVFLDKLGKKVAVRIALYLNCLAAVLLPLTNRNLILALMGLGAFYITYEFALISGLTLMSEVMPKARATLMSVTIASISLGRMLGSLIGPSLYRIDFWASCIMAVLLNVAALAVLTRVHIQSNPVVEYS